MSVTVYRTPRPALKSGFGYKVRWYGPEGKREKMFTAEKAALEEAQFLADGIAGQYPAILTDLTSSDAEELRRIREICGDVHPIQVVTEWAKERDRIRRSPTLAKVWADFTAFKEAGGVRIKENYGRVRGQIMDAWGARPMRDITGDELHVWLAATYPHPVTRNTIRKRMVTAWKWAADRGMVDREHGRTQAELIPTVREPQERIGIITPEQAEEVVAIVRARCPELLPSLGLALYCGLRRKEVHAQAWEDIDLERGILRVTAAKPRTPAYRLVQIRPPALALLEIKRNGQGLVSHAFDVDRIRRNVRDGNGPALPDNCFRHSWISYLVALSGDVAAVAHEAGNSPTIIFRHYRELVSRADAERFWGIPDPSTRNTGKPSRSSRHPATAKASGLCTEGTSGRTG